MSHKIFWSWQSDRPGAVSRHFLKSALEKALVVVGEDLGLDECERPGLDHDTKDESGLISIPESILAKIDGAAVFVADLTPVACSERGRWIANPNVLIELGYAKKAVGPSRIILVWNDAWGGTTPEDLPFDLRHRRAPITYSLPDGASKEERKRVERALVRTLASAIVACLQRVAQEMPDAPVWPTAVPARPGDPSVWFGAGSTLNVNADTSFGADRVTFDEAGRSYVRILPQLWPSGIRPEFRLDGGAGEIRPLGDPMGLSWGPTKGGLISYHVSDREKEHVTSKTATQWFALNGELWGFDGGVIFESDEGLTLATTYVVECWARFLRRAASFYGHYGVPGPFRVELGITGLEGVHWPTNGLFQSTLLGLEPQAHISEELPSLSKDEREGVLLLAHTAMLHAFGLPKDENEFRKILSETRRP